MLQSALMQSALVVGIVKVAAKGLGPFTLSDLDAFASKDNRLGRFAGERPMVSPLRGPPDSPASSPGGEG